MQSSVCAAVRPAVSRRVSARAACPRRLYYTRYSTAAAVSMSQSTATRGPTWVQRISVLSTTMLLR